MKIKHIHVGVQLILLKEYRVTLGMQSPSPQLGNAGEEIMTDKFRRALLEYNGADPSRSLSTPSAIREKRKYIKQHS